MIDKSILNEGLLSEIRLFNYHDELFLNELHLGERTKLCNCPRALHKQEDTGRKTCKMFFQFQQVFEKLPRLVPLVGLFGELDPFKERRIRLYFVPIEMRTERMIVVA